MNKKGFTLVELIAVIVLLALVITVVSTNGFGAFNNSKDKISSLNEKALKESFNLIKSDIEHCDSNITNDLLVEFGLTNCDSLYNELLKGIDVSIDNLKNLGYISEKDIEELSAEEKEKYKTMFYTNNGSDIKYTRNGVVTLLKRDGEASEEKYYEYNEKIKEIKFVDYIDTSEATYNWEVQEESSGTKIIAWLEINETDNTKYDLYFGSEGRIYAPEDSSYFFKNFQYLEKISFENFYTGNTTNMQYLFADCFNLKTLNLEVFNTKEVENMQYMFYNLENLEEMNFGDNFNTSNVITMGSMFRGMKKFELLELNENFNTSSVQNMEYMLSDLHNLKRINFGKKFNTSSVNNMSHMFENTGQNGKLGFLDLSKFNVGVLTNKEDMFSGAKIKNGLYLSEDNKEKLGNGTSINSSDIDIILK